jgi:hypothetical protein
MCDVLNVSVAKRITKSDRIRSGSLHTRDFEHVGRTRLDEIWRGRTRRGFAHMVPIFLKLHANSSGEQDMQTIFHTNRALMRSDQKIDRIAYGRSDRAIFNNRWLRLCLKDVGQPALLAIVLSGAVGFTTSCSSMGGGTNLSFAKAAPIVPNARPGIVPKDDAVYQPPRSPVFDDLNGG